MTAPSEARAARVAAIEVPPDTGFSLIANTKLIALYSAMVQCRSLAERCAQPATLGREAEFAGIALDLLPEDALSLPARDAVAGFLKGLPLAVLLGATPASEVESTAASRRMIPPAPTLAAQLNIACGVALARKDAGGKPVVVVFCGEFAGELATLGRALQYAGEHRLPILFVTHLAVRSDSASVRALAEFEKVSAEALTHGTPTMTVDANDVVALYRVACESIHHARQGNGPTLIECQSSGALHAKDQKIDPDPLVTMEAYLSRKGLYDQDLGQRIAAGFRMLLDEATGSPRI